MMKQGISFFTFLKPYTNSVRANRKSLEVVYEK